MADIEKTPVIQFRTDDSGLMKGVTSIKELKTAIAQLRDEEVRLRQAGADTTKTTTELQAAQRELNAVMGLTKKSADGVEGSYDSLVAKLREAKTEWRALPKFINGELNPAWEKARQQVEQYNTALKDMDASVGNYQRNVGNYKSALDGFSGTMGQAAQIGGQFNNGLAAMSGLMGIVGADTSEMDSTMKNLQITVGLLNGARGFAGLLKQLGDYLKISVKSATATKADAAAKKLDVAATNEMTVSETAAAGATTLLGTALKAIGIGLIVAALAFVVDHLEDIAGWLTGIAEKLGIIKKNNEGQLSAAEKTKQAYEKEKDELDKQVKIMQAKGKSQRDILKFQIQQITASIKTKEAELESAKATLERLKQHNWIQRVLHGEQGEYKEIKKYIEEATEELKEQKKVLSETEFDLELEGYREEAEAAKNARSAAEKKRAEEERKAAEALKKAQDIVNKGIEEGTKAITEQMTAAQKLDAEFKKDEKTITDAINKLKTTTGLTGEIKDLETGLAALRSNYYTKKFELQAAEAAEKIVGAKEKEYEVAEEIEYVNSKVFGYTNEIYDASLNISTAEKKKLDTLKEEQKYYRSQVELSDEMLESLKGVDQKDIVAEFGEPLATAIKLYFDKSKELRSAGFSIYEGVLSAFEERYKEQIENGKFYFAQNFADNLNQQLRSEFEEMGFGDDFMKYLSRTMERIQNEVIRESDFPITLNIRDNSVEYLTELREKLREYHQKFFEDVKKYQKEYEETGDEGAFDKWMEAETNLYDMYLRLNSIQDEIVEKQKQKYKDLLSQFNKYMTTYATATTNVLNNTANLWSAVIDAKQKDIDKQKEQGKISEKEYRRRTEENKKSFDNLKNLQIGVAIINTAAAVVQALADTTVPSYYVKAANAIAAGIAGAAEIVKIKSTDFSGGGSYEANTSAPSLTQSAPVVNTYGINPADYAEANAQNPVRVYVVESDITEAQNASRVRVEESTF